ncbi:hypothetical protein BDW02DRAFT_575067 [Decorospora gaudefroyi]|uniref:Uncharacterized protein n=1 Tax=Decorospora gaudefroyi TaxID=184978 RepID=A0A6A5JWK8_9PLEO|nr:hypothetical protein BDW02DRAFT_575067 [Decorospora gaudefroyi]
MDLLGVATQRRSFEGRKPCSAASSRNRSMRRQRNCRAYASSQPAGPSTQPTSSGKTGGSASLQRCKITAVMSESFGIFLKNVAKTFRMIDPQVILHTGPEYRIHIPQVRRICKIPVLNVHGDC